jgi:hypothetical protein
MRLLVCDGCKTTFDDSIHGAALPSPVPNTSDAPTLLCWGSESFSGSELIAVLLKNGDVAANDAASLIGDDPAMLLVGAGVGANNDPAMLLVGVGLLDGTGTTPKSPQCAANAPQNNEVDNKLNIL